MEKKLEKFVSKVGKNAKDLLDKSKEITIQVADQNADGKFDMEDVSAIAESVGKAMKKGGLALKETIDEKARQLELKNLSPIFLDTLNTEEFILPKFIRVTDRDKKHAESEVCQGSIGFGTDQKELHIVNIFKDSIDAFGLSFYPDCDSEFYYVDPSDRNCYIALNEYFSYLKIARISELQKIAQNLGAKHFKVTYKEEKVSFLGKKTATKINAKLAASAEVEHDYENKKYSSADIAAEMEFPGHDPEKPIVKYWKNDPNIINLVEMRMNEQTPLLHQKFMLKLSNMVLCQDLVQVKMSFSPS